jgi:hypothetical protein
MVKIIGTDSFGPTAAEGKISKSFFSLSFGLFYNILLFVARVQPDKTVIKSLK